MICQPHATLNMSLEPSQNGPSFLNTTTLALATAIGEGKVPGLQKRDLIRLLIHETWRIYGDRLVYPEEKQWTDERLDAVCRESRRRQSRKRRSRRQRHRLGDDRLARRRDGRLATRCVCRQRIDRG